MKLIRILLIAAALLSVSLSQATADTYTYDALTPDVDTLVQGRIFAKDSIEVEFVTDDIFSSISSLVLDVDLYDDDDDCCLIPWEAAVFKVSVNDIELPSEIKIVEGSVTFDILEMADLADGDSDDVAYTVDISDGVDLSLDPTNLVVELKIIPVCLSDFYYGGAVLTVDGVLYEAGDSDPMLATPVPAGIILFATGMLGILGLRRKV